MSLTNVRLQAQKRALHLFENPGKFLWMGFASHSRQEENQTLRMLIRAWAPEKTPATWRNPACGMGGQQEGLLRTWTWLGAAQGGSQESRTVVPLSQPNARPHNTVASAAVWGGRGITSSVLLDRARWAVSWGIWVFGRPLEGFFLRQQKSRASPPASCLLRLGLSGPGGSQPAPSLCCAALLCSSLPSNTVFAKEGDKLQWWQHRERFSKWQFKGIAVNFSDQRKY